MTTFTSDDREEAYKKIVAEAPNQPGYEDAVPIPESPPHVVDSGASVMIKELTDEEIRHIQAICHLKDVGYDNFIMRFARAILKKAKEK
jgi:hypothetical protein